MESTPSATNSSTGAGHVGAGVLLFPMPGAQGHLNPMLQFGPRLAYYGLHPTLVSTRYILSTTPPPGDPWPPSPTVSTQVAVPRAQTSLCTYPGWRLWGPRCCRSSSCMRPVRVLVYDPHVAWAARVVRAAGVPTTAFFSQPCAVNIIYVELCAGRLALPVTDARALVERGAMGVELWMEDVPPFVASPELSLGLRKTSVEQFEGLEEADDVLVNSFTDIESEEAKYTESAWRTKMIGPTLPSFYLDDNHLPSNKSYGFDLFGGDELYGLDGEAEH